jgi:crotonobetainyl-CoA:carnitine CoA-transferase CaiB-like acyl-CoA transferase
VHARRLADAPVLERRPLVVDLSSLWAGPLCAHLLGRHGADVVKVESTVRPDGARSGPPSFYAALHAGHRSVALDFASTEGRARLRSLLLAADVVIEASRPRALRQLGIDAIEVAACGPRVWLSITGYGREAAGGLAVAFGDDAAVAGGLVAWAPDGQPRFALDAVADPLTGLAAAGAVLDALAAGGRWLVDVALAGVAAAVMGDDAGAPWTPGEGHDPLPAPPPSASERVASLGEDTERVLSELASG